MLELLFHLFLVPVDLWAFLHVRRRRDVGALLQGLAALGTAALALSILGMMTQEDSRLFGSQFALIGLLALGIFLHGPVVLLGGAWLLRGEARGWAATSLVAALALVVVGVDAWFVEPTWLEVTHHRVVSPKLERALRIVVLSDIQTDRVGDYERRAIRLAVEQEPDLLVFTGDYIQAAPIERYRAECARLSAMFAEEGLAAPLGLLAVEGNVERPGWESIFVGFDAQASAGTSTSERGGLHLTGLSFSDSFDTRLNLAAREGFHIAVGHAPDYALGHIEADLLLAGHTHGGQIRIPGFGPPLTLSAVPRDWAAGRTELSGGRTLFVSRGIGLERGHAPRIRFFCRPELLVIDCVPAAKADASTDPTASSR